MPLGWLWSRINKGSEANDKLIIALNDHKLYVARHHFRKEEVSAIVKTVVAPLKESIDRQEKMLTNMYERRQNGKGDR